MFGEDVSDQWQRKKQTPEQKKAARMAKLDPANWKSAKDVYDERSAEAAKKRKREQEGDEESQEPTAQQEQPVKKQKTTDNPAQPKPKPTEKLTERLDSDRLQNMNLKKKMKKRAHRAEKKQQKREQQEDPTSEKPASTTQNTTDKKSSPLEQKKPSKWESRDNQEWAESASRTATKAKGEAKEEVVSTARPRQRPQTVGEQDVARAGEVEEVTGVEEGWSDVEEETSELGQEEASNDDEAVEDDDKDEEMADADSTATSSEGVPDILSPPHDSASSSVSSVVPPAQTQPVKAARKPDTKNDESEPTQPMDALQTDAERQAARQRLQEQISQFRSQRKADDKPVRSRAELLAQRRQKEQERKAVKKEQRRKEKEEEAKRQDEEMARRFSPGGSGSLLASPRSPMIDDGGSNAFTFGRIAFDDGTQFDAATGSAAANKKHKGPADPATALKAAQAKQARVAALDDQKKQSIEEKDMWLNAKKRAHGERVKDDTSLLKKALKRQEKQKQRSGKDWDARLEGVRSSQEAKQKKRTENLQKRKDEKGTKKTGKKKVKRPGFEGSFRGRTGKSKKN